MKTLKDLTPEIQAKIPEYIKQYTAGVFDGKRYDNFNYKDAEALIDWNYETAKYKKPCILVAENLYEAQLFFNYISANDKVFLPIIYAIYCVRNGIEPKMEVAPPENKKLRSQLDSQLDSQLRSQLDSQLYSQLDSQLDSQLRSQLRSQLYSQLRSQLRSQLYSQLDSQLDSQLYSKMKKYNPDYLFTTNVYSNAYAGYFNFIKDEFKLDAPINVMLDSWNNLYQKSNVYSAIFSELLCVVSKYPKKVYRNENNDMSNVNGVAVEWGACCEETDFDGCYYINGVNIGKELFDKLSDKKVTFKDFISEQNEEIKSAILSFYRVKFGEEYLFRFLCENLKEVDTYVDKKSEEYLIGTTGGMQVGVYTLFKGEISNEPIAYIRCYCPSSDRMFFLGVEPTHNTAKSAIASLYRIPKKLKSHISAINRQGEVFSTNFTKDGLSLIETMNKTDYQNLVSLTGDEYFSLLKYEY